MSIVQFDKLHKFDYSYICPVGSPGANHKEPNMNTKRHAIAVAVLPDGRLYDAVVIENQDTGDIAVVHPMDGRYGSDDWMPIGYGLNGAVVDAEYQVDPATVAHYLQEAEQ